MSPVHFFERSGLSMSPSTADIYGGHCLAPKLPSQPCPRAPLGWEQGKVTLAAPYHRKNVKIVCSHIQHFRIFLLMPFLYSSSSFSLLLNPFLPASHSSLFSFSCCCCSFSLSPPVTPAHCVSLSFFLLPAHFPLLLSQPFCFCSLIISFPSSAFLCFTLSSLHSLPPPNHLAVLCCCII